MASGVTVSEDVVELYRVLKLRKTNFRFVVMHIDEGQIKVEYTQDKNADMKQEDEYNDMLQRLPKDVGRYIVVDLSIPQKNGAIKDLMFLISWNPDGAPTKSNILYTMSKKALTDKISEGMIELQANDLSDLNYSDLLEKGCK